MNYHFATLEDVSLLARMSRQLAEDTNHPDKHMPEKWFQKRMNNFLLNGHNAVFFEVNSRIMAFALYTDHPSYHDTIFLREIFVDRKHRGNGIGKLVMNALKAKIWPKDKRLIVDVLICNDSARTFYKAMGFQECSMKMEIPVNERIAL